MKDIEKRALEHHKYIKEQKNKDIQDYVNWNEEFKQDAWNSYIFQLLQNHRMLSSTHDPELINFSDFRKNNKYSEVEDNIDRFLPWVIEALYWFYDENLFEIIFKLDEQAKEYLQRKEIKERIEQILL